MTDEEILSAVQALLLVRAAPRASAEPSQGPRFMTIRDYARHAGFSERYIRSLIKMGLPVTAVPAHHPRVIVDEADQWIAHGGEARAVERSALVASRQ
jgi:hypothetical protein